MRWPISRVFDGSHVFEFNASRLSIQRPTIAPMQILRNAHLLARFVLVWFALSIGVAIASPLVNPQGIEVICSGAGGMKLLVQTEDGSRELGCNTLDCPLCGMLGAAPPPPAATARLAPQSALAYVMQHIPAAVLASLSAAPPPARGPPLIS